MAVIPNTDSSRLGLSSEEYDQLQGVHDSVAELLKHFWMCFPPSTPEMSEKASFPLVCTKYRHCCTSVTITAAKITVLLGKFLRAVQSVKLRFVLSTIVCDVICELYLIIGSFRIYWIEIYNKVDNSVF